MKIAIMGSHPATKRLAPFDDPEWKIWACSPHNFEHGILPRVDEWFEVHKPAFCPDTRKAEYQDYVRSLAGKIPVWVRDKEAHPDARDYPEEELKKQFGPFRFTSSIAYIMAAAIDKKPEAIGIYGVMQASETEYAYQRPGIQGLIEEAHRRGIDVYAPEVSQLFRPQEDIW
jgi:hypothetical protein